MNRIQQLQKKLVDLPDGSTEGSYYAPLQTFLETQFDGISATAQETAPGKVGVPDITVRNDKGKIAGWIEVKTPDEVLSDKRFKAQFDKYRSALDNIIFTNFRQWQLWQRDRESGESVLVREVHCDILSNGINGTQDLLRLFEQFNEHATMQYNTAEDLALALARRAKFLSEQVKENLDEDDKRAILTHAKEMFNDTLVDKISAEQFANMVVETLTYSLLLAAIESQAQDEQITIRTAPDYLPQNVPVLKSLYDAVIKASADVNEIRVTAELIIDQLQVQSLYAILTAHKLMGRTKEDPILYFYEPFLKEYDPVERKQRGAFYTPKPVVDFIVRATDHLLEKKFGKQEGLANDDVRILDPATGTGAFLLSAVHHIYDKLQATAVDAGMGQDRFSDIVTNHILKNFYGFELMIAPYTVAHLKLALELRNLGVNVAERDSRLQIYLANTLDSPNAQPEVHFGFEAMALEAEKAIEIKQKEPILAIIGNPPYSNFGKMNQQEWITDLLKDYKQGLSEKKFNSKDDYIKFIRFAQWKITQSGKGIFAMITSNSFLDGITRRGMRQSLLNTFDEIYIYNLHGSLIRGETTPTGGIDENVFDIRTGVSINIFVKNEQSNADCKLFYADAFGRRQTKFKLLREQSFDEVSWQEIDYQSFNQSFAATEWGQKLGNLNFFIPSAEGTAGKMAEYGKFWGARDIFTETNSGIQTKRDKLTVQFEKEALKTIADDFANLDTESLRAKYNLPADGRDWTVDNAKQDLAKHENLFVDILYRPFDWRKTIFTGKTKGFIAYPRKQTMEHMLKPNLGVCLPRLCKGKEGFEHGMVANRIIDIAFGDAYSGSGTYFFPLYTYRKANGTCEQISNLTAEFMVAITAKLGEKPAPEAIFYYAYAIFHCPQYRERYAELLKIDFPRLPLTSDKDMFYNLSELGKELVNLHLLGENPFDTDYSYFKQLGKLGVSAGRRGAANELKWDLPHLSLRPTGPPVTYEWEIQKVQHRGEQVYVNATQFFDGIDADTWNFKIGGYQPLEKWLTDRKKHGRPLTTGDKEHYIKMAAALRETRRVMGEIDALVGDISALGA